VKGPKFHINQEVLITMRNDIVAVGYISAYFFNDTNLTDDRNNKRAFRYLIVGYGKDNHWSTELWENDIGINEEFI